LGKLGHNDGVKLDNGNIHWGTTLCGVPHGFGRMKFSSGFCKNAGKNYVFYEGLFECGYMSGKGSLLLEDNSIMSGEFYADHLHG